MSEPTKGYETGRVLHQRDARGHTLTEAERQILDSYRTHVEVEEARLLRPAVVAREVQIAYQEAKIRDMEQLLVRTRTLRAQLLDSLNFADKEKAEIVSQYARLMSSPEPVR